MRRRRLGTLLLFATSLVVALGTAELGLRLAGYESLHDVYSTPELFWRHDDLLGWSLEPDARGRFVGPRPYPVEFEAEIETNAWGLRGPDPTRRRPGERRMLVLGDSYVAGFEVAYEETFTALLEAGLERRLRAPVRVINAGVRGYGTDQSYLWFRERGKAFAPELVILVFSANDFDDNMTLHRARRPFGKPAFALRANGALEPVGTPVPRYPMCSSWVLGADYEPVRADGMASRLACLAQLHLADLSALFTVVAMSLARLPGVARFLGLLANPEAERARAPAEASLLPLPLPRARIPSREERARLSGALTTALLGALGREVRTGGGRFLLLMRPQHYERIDVNALRAQGIAIDSVPVSDVIDPHSLTFQNDSHLNARGHRVFAEGMLPIVERALGRR